jgi:hypothetical protein
MPLVVPTIDDRAYQDILDEALARVPVHNPEWTNFRNESDPGVTLVQLFAFMTETLLYRSNQIPERNRRAFLQLLGLPLRPAASARGLVTLSNERGPLQTQVLARGLELRAGQVPFRTERALDVLPVESRVYYKRRVANIPQRLLDYYRQLYLSYLPNAAATPLLYETVPLPPPEVGAQPGGIDLLDDTVDGSLWIALLARQSDTDHDRVRAALAGRTISLGVVPVLAEPERHLVPSGAPSVADAPVLHFQVPQSPAPNSWTLPGDPNQLERRVPAYVSLDTRGQGDVLSEPGIVEVTLPATPFALRLWDNLDPLEQGVGDFPPALADQNFSQRVITWLRVRIPTSRLAVSGASRLRARLLWIGINTVPVTQRARVMNEALPAGTGEPDQQVTLARTPVVPGSVRLTVSDPTSGDERVWQEYDDLLAAGPEVVVRDPRLPPGSPQPPPLPSEVFALDPEAGHLTFGDGMRGKRPPFGARLRASYDVGLGRAGNVGSGAINGGPALPAGFKVANPIPTWGGAAAETVAEGEQQVPRYLQHRDRLVTAADFKAIVLRTPGVDLGRVEVLPAYSPIVPQSQPGNAPGAVTVLVIPRFDPVQPDAPLPDRLFLDTVCAWVDPRRLVTTEVFLRGPVYTPIWISIGLTVLAGRDIASVVEAVKQEMREFLSPIPLVQPPVLVPPERSPSDARRARDHEGWPLAAPVTRLELWAVANRVEGVSHVNRVLLAATDGDDTDAVAFSGLRLPRIAGLAVSLGEPLALNQLRGQTLDVAGLHGADAVVPLPFVPEECR